jgi:hypothetical protein
VRRNTATVTYYINLQDQANAEVAVIREQYQAAISKVLVLAEKDLQELRTYSSPPATIEAVLAAVCVILGFPSDWNSVMTLLNHSDVPIFSRIASFDLASMRTTRVAQLARLASSPDLHPDRVRTVSAAAHSLVLWVHAVNDHAKLGSIRLWERNKLQEVLQRQAVAHVRYHLSVSTDFMLLHPNFALTSVVHGKHNGKLQCSVCLNVGHSLCLLHVCQGTLVVCVGI